MKAPPESKVGTPVRVLLLVVGVLVLFLGVKMFVLSPPAEVSLEADVVPHVVRPTAAPAPAAAVAAAKAVAAASNARSSNTGSAAAGAPAVAAVKPVAAKPKAPAVVLDARLPKPLAAALRSAPVAVVSLFAPDSAVSGIAKLEALAGAAAGGVPFVGVDVHKQAQVSPFTGLLGVMSDPTVLVFQRPGKVFVRLDGWVDRDTIAQAIQNAKTAEPTP